MRREVSGLPPRVTAKDALRGASLVLAITEVIRRGVRIAVAFARAAVWVLSQPNMAGVL